MSVLMNKELLIRVSESLYIQVKKICNKEYKLMSAFVRELMLERISDNLTVKESAMLEKSRKEFKEGKGTPWRDIKRG